MQPLKNITNVQNFQFSIPGRMLYEHPLDVKENGNIFLTFLFNSIAFSGLAEFEISHSHIPERWSNYFHDFGRTFQRLSQYL